MDLETEFQKAEKELAQCLDHFISVSLCRARQPPHRPPQVLGQPAEVDGTEHDSEHQQLTLEMLETINWSVQRLLQTEGYGNPQNRNQNAFLKPKNLRSGGSGVYPENTAARTAHSQPSRATLRPVSIIWGSSLPNHGNGRAAGDGLEEEDTQTDMVNDAADEGLRVTLDDDENDKADDFDNDHNDDDEDEPDEVQEQDEVQEHDEVQQQDEVREQDEVQEHDDVNDDKQDGEQEEVQDEGNAKEIGDTNLRSLRPRIPFPYNSKGDKRHMDSEDQMQSGGRKRGRALSPDPIRPTKRPQSPKPAPSNKKKSDTHGRKGKKAAEKTLPVLLFPAPNHTQFSKEALKVLQAAMGWDLSIGQAELLKSTSHYLPVTKSQWNHFGHLVDQLQPFVDGHGAFLIHPQLDDRFGNSDVEHTLDFLLIQKSNKDYKRVAEATRMLPNCSWSWIEFKSSQEKIKTYTCKISSDSETEEQPIGLSEFESRNTTTAYARDISEDQYRSLISRFKLPELLTDLDGNELPTTPRFEGVNTPYLFWGQRGSSFYLHIEDENLWSVNYLHSGKKLWVIIPPSNKEKLDCLLKSIWDITMGRPICCAQYARHLDLFIPIETLEKWNIGYYLLEHNAGQAMVTAPGTYHQGINMTGNIAVATNYGRSWDPSDYPLCSDGCASTAILNVAAHSDRKLRVNDSEQVTLKEIARAREGMVNRVCNPKTDERIGGVAAAELVKLILHIGSSSVLEAMLTALQGEKQELLRKPCIDAVSSYRALEWAENKTTIGELVKRIAVVKLHKVVLEALRSKRKRRAHGKIGDPERRQNEVIKSIAQEIAVTLRTVPPNSGNAWLDQRTEAIVKKIKKYWKMADTYIRMADLLDSKVSKGLGAAVLILLPGSVQCRMLEIRRPYEILNQSPGMIEVFVERFQQLRPGFLAPSQEQGLQGQLMRSLQQCGIIPAPSGGDELLTSISQPRRPETMI